MDPSEYECAICQNLLLDPVVGPCGHDYCQFCLWRWRTTSKSARSTTVACPLCREPIPGELGVCLRLRETIQRFFPEEVKRRRVEVQERKQVLDAEVARQQAESSQRSTTVRHASPSSETAHASSSAQHVSRWVLSRQRTRPMPRSPPAATSASAEQPGPSSAQPAPSGAVATGAPDTWIPPATLCFTLGWYDPAETRGRRSIGRRRRVIAA